MTKWKDIETAPKDGTRILLFIPKYDIVVSGMWAEIPGEYDGGHCYYPAFYDWCVDDELIIFDDYTHRPQYWLPLVELPKDAK